MRLGYIVIPNSTRTQLCTILYIPPGLTLMGDPRYKRYLHFLPISKFGKGFFLGQDSLSNPFFFVYELTAVCIRTITTSSQLVNYEGSLVHVTIRVIYF